MILLTAFCFLGKVVRPAAATTPDASVRLSQSTQTISATGAKLWAQYPTYTHSAGEPSGEVKLIEDAQRIFDIVAKGTDLLKAGACVQAEGCGVVDAGLKARH